MLNPNRLPKFVFAVLLVPSLVWLPRYARAADCANDMGKPWNVTDTLIVSNIQIPASYLASTLHILRRFLERPIPYDQLMAKPTTEDSTKLMKAAIKVHQKMHFTRESLKPAYGLETATHFIERAQFRVSVALKQVVLFTLQIEDSMGPFGAKNFDAFFAQKHPKVESLTKVLRVAEDSPKVQSLSKIYVARLAAGMRSNDPVIRSANLEQRRNIESQMRTELMNAARRVDPDLIELVLSIQRTD